MPDAPERWLAGTAAICRARRIVREFVTTLPLESRVGCDGSLDARAPLTEDAAAAALHVRLPSEARALSRLAASAHVRAGDLEAALAHLAAGHDLDSCPGGEECPFAGFEPHQLTHF
jgi:hypothetical protein